MLSNRLQERLERGEVAYGIVVSWPDSDLIEAAAACGFDFVFIDAEHGPLDIGSCAELVRAANSGGISALIRVPFGDVRGVYKYLDTGATGLIFPHVISASDAESAVSACLFPPEGSRGSMSSSRAARYGVIHSPDEYFRAANESVWAIPMIEDVAGVEAVDQILSTRNLRAIFIGPGDLSLSRVATKSEAVPSVETLVDRAIAACVRSGKYVATVGATPVAATAMVERGASIIVTGATTLFTSACRGYLDAAPRRLRGQSSS